MRTTEDRTAIPTKILLSAGQSHTVWTGRDTVLLVQSGSIRMSESPEWMGDVILRTLSTLHEGQHYQIARSGWICLYASSAAEVLCYAGNKSSYFSLRALLSAAHAVSAPVRWLRTMAAQLLAPR